MTEPSCILLEAISKEAVGGKAEGLVRLLSYGFDVPAGFVVIGASSGCLPDDLDEHYDRIGAGKSPCVPRQLGKTRARLRSQVSTKRF